MPFTAVIQPLQMKNVLKEENLKAWPEQGIGMKTSLIFRRVWFSVLIGKQIELFCNALSLLQRFLILLGISYRHSLGGLLLMY